MARVFWTQQVLATERGLLFKPAGDPVLVASKVRLRQ